MAIAIEVNMVLVTRSRLIMMVFKTVSTVTNDMSSHRMNYDSGHNDIAFDNDDSVSY